MEIQLIQPRPVEAPAAALSPPQARLRPIALAATLFKLRISVAIVLAALGGALLAAGHWPGPLDIVVLSLGVLIASAGAGACNHWFERDIDACMRRTCSRPFVAGVLTPTLRWLLLFAAMIVVGSGLVALWFNPLAGAMVAGGALSYALVYTVWLKRRTHWGIVIGGIAGSFAVWGGAAAFGDITALPVSLLALVLFLWTPSHFWALAIAIVDDYRRAGVPMLPVTHGVATAARWTFVNTVLLVVSGLALAWAVGSVLVWIGALLGGFELLRTNRALLREQTPAVAMRAFRASLVQLGLLLGALFIALGLP